MGEFRTPWSIIAMVLLTLTAAQLTLPLPSHATPSRALQVAGSLRLSDDTVAPGQQVALTGKLPPRKARTVRLQTFRDGSWTVIGTQKSSRRGAFRFSISSPTAAGRRTYRVLAPAAMLGGRRYASVVTPTRSLTVLTLTSVDVGWRHDCAVAGTGDAWCWGDNTYGELGDGSVPTFTDATPTIAPRPLPVVGSDWSTVTATGSSTCGLKSNGGAWCWGDLATYQFADPSLAGTPQQLTGSWTQVAPGAAFYWCGVDDQGTGWCQGKNDDGQLGDPAGGQAAPTELPGTWQQVVPGAGWEGSATTCGIRTDLSAWCWGAGTHGQLGNDASDSSPVPVEVVGEHQWASLSVGGSHVCGVDTAGAGWCWGGENSDGRLGNGSYAPSDVPVRVTVAATWASIDAGFFHTCGVTTTGEGWCWGRNDDAQLGNGASETDWWPAPVPHRLEGTWTSVAAGQTASAGTQSDGTAWAWGEGAYGQLGHGQDVESTVPLYVLP